MTPEDFDFIAAAIKKQSGLVLTKEKAYLLDSRLMPVARANDLKDLDELVKFLRAQPGGALMDTVTEAMTTNESFFFRDKKPFDLFRDFVLPHFLEKRAAAKTIRIWCAAASNGQEPYSLAIVLKEEAAKFPGWRTRILGTDISREVLEKARKGLYTQFEVQRGLPIQQLVAHFTKEGDMWLIDATLKAMVDYKEFNLLNDFGSLGMFDVVFCRNVLIYFDVETKTRILEGISKRLPADGLLFLGGAETVLGISDKFKPVPGQRGVYCLTGSELGDKVA
jgi:chemotaxis protein methyltransferase CheR